MKDWLFIKYTIIWIPICQTTSTSMERKDLFCFFRGSSGVGHDVCPEKIVGWWRNRWFVPMFLSTLGDFWTKGPWFPKDLFVCHIYFLGICFHFDYRCIFRNTHRYSIPYFFKWVEITTQSSSNNSLFFGCTLTFFSIDFRIVHPFLVEFPHQTASLSCPPVGWLTLLKNPMFRGWGPICQWQVHQYPGVWNLIFINQMRWDALQ